MLHLLLHLLLLWPAERWLIAASCRFLDVENALKYWKHRVAIRMVLGYADRKQPSLGDSTWPQVEYPYCSPSSDDTGGTYQCDGLQGKKVVLSIQTEPLFVDLNDVCGVNINGCGFNEVSGP